MVEGKVGKKTILGRGTSSISIFNLAFMNSQRVCAQDSGTSWNWVRWKCRNSAFLSIMSKELTTILGISKNQSDYYHINSFCLKMSALLLITHFYFYLIHYRIQFCYLMLLRKHVGYCIINLLYFFITILI